MNAQALTGGQPGQVWDVGTMSWVFPPVDARSDRFPEEQPKNPKDAIATNKVPVHLWPAVASMHGAMALLDGQMKYGRTNWRATPVRASVYVGAALRHLNDYFEGKTWDESGCHNLGHGLACLAIVLDAEAAGTLIDDRQFNGAGYRKTLELLTPLVAKIQANYAGQVPPHHYSIADNK